MTRQALTALRAGARLPAWGLRRSVVARPLLLDDRDASADRGARRVGVDSVLECSGTLTPDERAVFVLREVFGFGYDEIAAAVDDPPSRCDQILSRPRARAGAAQTVRTADDAQTAEITEQF